MDNLKLNFPSTIRYPVSTIQCPVYCIKVIGIGGAGCNAISHILSQTSTKGASLPNLVGQGSASSGNSINSTIHFISANTDIQALFNSSIYTPIKGVATLNSILQLGPILTKGLGAGGRPAIGRESAHESLDSIKSLLHSTIPSFNSATQSTFINVLFILSGMGGGTGTGASPVFAQIAKELGFFVVGIITTPFDFEGPIRTNQAIDGIYALKRFSNALIIIPNQKLTQFPSKADSPLAETQSSPSNLINSTNTVNSMNFKDAFALSNDLIAHTVYGIINIIIKPGIINVDLADVCSLLSEPGDSCISFAKANGPDKASIAASQAINSPLISTQYLKKASGVLLNITASENFSLNELKSTFDTIHTIVDKHCNIILGVSLDNNLHDELILTLIAAGIKDENQKSILKEKTLKIPALKRKIGIHSLTSNNQLLPFYKNLKIF